MGAAVLPQPLPSPPSVQQTRVEQDRGQGVLFTRAPIQPGRQRIGVMDLEPGVFRPSRRTRWRCPKSSSTTKNALLAPSS
jgi:hypothetical protein